MIFLVTPDDYRNLSTRISTDDKGEFVARDIRQGQYTVFATRLESGARQATSTTIQVGDSDLPGVVLQIQPFLEVSGSIVREGDGGKDLDLSTLQVFASPTDVTTSMLGGSGVGQVKADGTFKIDQLAPGRYNVRVNGQGGDYYIKSILAGREEVHGKDVEAAALVSGGLKIVLGFDGASVDGSVEIPDDRKPVLRAPMALVFPAQAQRRTSDANRLAPIDRNGSFHVKNLAPGDYLAIALEDSDYSTIQDPGFLAALEAKATKISLDSREVQSISLKLLPWPAEFADRLQ
jgi:hypothetical protein